MTPNLPCHWEEDKETIPGCVQKRFDHAERSKQHGWSDEQAAVLAANMEKAEENRKTWRDPPVLSRSAQNRIT
jgi:hypothetical protein